MFCLVKSRGGRVQGLVTGILGGAVGYYLTVPLSHCPECPIPGSGWMPVSVQRPAPPRVHVPVAVRHITEVPSWAGGHGSLCTHVTVPLSWCVLSSLGLPRGTVSLFHCPACAKPAGEEILGSNIDIDLAHPYLATLTISLSWCALSVSCLLVGWSQTRSVVTICQCRGFAVGPSSPLSLSCGIILPELGM